MFNARSVLRPRVWVTALLLAAIAAAGFFYFSAPPRHQGLILLVPNASAREQPVTRAWVDAAREEGFQLSVVTADEFLRFPGTRNLTTGVIFPDTVHRQASSLLIDSLSGYVANGGKLFVAFDAGILDAQDNTYASAQSRLSELVGVGYGFYGKLRGRTIASGPVFASEHGAAQLGIQPGKIDFNGARPGLGEMTTYGYKELTHSFFRTSLSSTATVLMESKEGDAIVAQRQVGKGTVLFANLPLGYLKTRTDAYMLHRLLSYFGEEVVQQPHLAAVPSARGGLVLNLHVDSNAAQKPLLDQEQTGFFAAGPFSFHVTAGPDTFKEGDAMGLNIPANDEMKKFLLRMAAAGHEVGSHGGWGHNIYGERANATNRGTYEPMLDLNFKALNDTLGKPVRSYSAPMGNQPSWATHWLERTGHKAYYFTGDSGLGPTRSYYEGDRPTAGLWAFPISNFLKIATFEELGDEPSREDSEAFSVFLQDLVGYVSRRRVARLFYFHPPAAPMNGTTLDQLMQAAAAQSRTGRFEWYTMERLADFMTRREKAIWSVSQDTRQASKRLLQVASPAGLNELSWIFPAASAKRFTVMSGTATVRKEGSVWIVVAGECNDLRVSIE